MLLLYRLAMIMMIYPTISNCYFNITIFHNSDIYSRFEEMMDYKTNRFVGGMARLSRIIDHARNTSRNPVLFLNAGNTFSGTYFYHIYRWKIVAEFLNALKPDAISLGGLEFVDGLRGLEPFLQGAKFPILAANINSENNTVFHKIVQPSIVLEINNIQIGIIGYIGKETAKDFNVGNLKFTDEIEAIETECAHLADSGVKIIIALGRADFKTDQKIARSVDCIDLLIGGDSSMFLWNDEYGAFGDDKPKDSYPMLMQSTSGKLIPVVEGYSKTRYLGKLHLSFDADGNLMHYRGEPLVVDDRYQRNPNILTLLNEYKPVYKSTGVTGDGAEDPLGKVKVFLTGDKCREEECNLGNMIMDAFIEYKASKYKGQYWTDTPIAFMNAGAVRKSINTTSKEFNITIKDLETAIPFRQPLITVVLQGYDLKHTLEVGARYNGETRRGEFLIISGIRVIYDFQRPPFSRVISAMVRCGKCKTPSYSPLKNNEYYRILTTVYLANGGDGHTSIRKSSMSFALEGVTELAVTSTYIQTYSELRPECDERILHMKYVGGGRKSGGAVYSVILCFLLIIVLGFNIQ